MISIGSKPPVFYNCVIDTTQCLQGTGALAMQMPLAGQPGERLIHRRTAGQV